MQVIWTATAARALALKVMVKVLLAQVDEAGAVVAAGRTNAQEGVAEAKVTLPKVAMMCDEAGVTVMPVQERVTTTPVWPAEPFDKVTAPVVMAPTAVMATVEAAAVVSRTASAESLVVMVVTPMAATVAVLVIPEQVKAKVEPRAAPAVSVIVKMLVARAAVLTKAEG